LDVTCAADQFYRFDCGHRIGVEREPAVERHFLADDAVMAEGGSFETVADAARNGHVFILVRSWVMRKEGLGNVATYYRPLRGKQLFLPVAEVSAYVPLQYL
jgi:hypothetical protein